MNLDIYQRAWAGETLTFVMSGRARWRLTGPDGTRYLNGQVTADIARLSENQGCYAAVCTAKGRMEGDVFIARYGDDFYLDADALLHDSLGARLEKYLIADDAAFEDLDGLWSLSHVFGQTPPPAPDHGFVISRARFGLPGHDVWAPDTTPVVVGDTVDADVVETLRLEHGIPRWDAELTSATLPPEGGPHLLEAISYTKGCYVGQETVARLKSVGHVNRTLVFLESESADFPEVKSKLTADDREAGTVTSAGLSPRRKRGIALGYVQRAFATEGTVLQTGNLKLTVSTP